MIGRWPFRLSEDVAEAPLSTIWKATLWLEARFHKEPTPLEAVLISQHYEIMSAHREVREDLRLVELLLGHARYWASLTANHQLQRR